MYCISPLIYIPFFVGLNNIINKNENNINPINSTICLYLLIEFSNLAYFGPAYFKCINNIPNIIKLSLKT